MLLSRLSPNPDDAERRLDSIRRALEIFFLRRRCSEAEDLAAEVLTRMVRDSAKWTADAEVLQVAYGYAQNVYREWVRKQATAEKYWPELRRLAAESRRSAGSAEFRACFGQLSPEDRERLCQYYVDGLTADEVAPAWNLGPNGVRARVKRLLDRIRDCMARQAP